MLLLAYVFSGGNYAEMLREDSFIDFVRRNDPGTFLLDPYPLLEKRKIPKWSSDRGLDRRFQGKWA